MKQHETMKQHQTKNKKDGPKHGTTWNNMDQRGPTWNNVEQHGTMKQHQHKTTWNNMYANVKQHETNIKRTPKEHRRGTFSQSD